MWASDARAAWSVVETVPTAMPSAARDPRVDGARAAIAMAAPDGVREPFLDGVAGGIRVAGSRVGEPIEVASALTVDPLDLVE